MKIRSKTMLIYGAIMTVVTELWGGIGAFTHVIGFHHGKFITYICMEIGRAHV